MRDKTIGQIVEIAVRVNPILIGFSVLTLNFRLVKELAEKIKEKLPRVKIVLGGYHISTVPADITKSTAFDYGVLGYGEVPLRKLVERLMQVEGELNFLTSPNLPHYTGQVSFRQGEEPYDIAGLIIRDPYHLKDSIHLYAYVKVGLSKKQAELMAKAGFTVLAMGVESASSKTVRGFNKPYSSFSQVIEHMRNWDAVGGINRALLIFPTPADDELSKRELIARVKQALPDCIRIAHLCPSFGTPEGDRLREVGMVISDDYTLYDHNHLLVKTPNFSPEDAEEARQEVYTKYYTSPEYRAHVIGKIKKFPWLKESFVNFFEALYRSRILREELM